MINYTKRDYNDIRNELIASIPKYTDKWNDFSDSDLGIMFIDFLAGVSSMLNYYIDKEVSESRIMHATELRNIYSNLELLGYKRPLRKCAMASAIVEAPANKFYDSMYDFDITIPAYSLFTSTSDTSNAKMFFTNPYAITIRKGVSEVSFQMIQGLPSSKVYNTSVIQSYKLYLPSKKISDYNLNVVIDGVEWSQVDNAFLEIYGGQSYSIHRDAFDNVYLLFTYNYRDYLDTSSTITINYIETEGDIDVDANFVNNPNFQVLSPTGKDITKELNFKNTSNFSGGFVDEDENLAKAKAISRARVPKFLCTLEDYEDALFSYPGIKDVRCVDMSVQGVSTIKPYELIAYILMSDNNYISGEFKDELQEYIYAKQEITRSVIIKDAIRKNVELDIRFIAVNENVNLINLENDILMFLDDYYYNTSFGRVISREHIITSIINNFPDIKTLKLVSPAEDVIPNVGEVIDVVDIRVGGSYYE